MCSVRVCIPGEMLEAKARERNESCAVNHNLPHRRRRETHAESNNCIQSTLWQYTIKLSISPPVPVCRLTRFYCWLFFFYVLTFQSSFVLWPTCFHKPALSDCQSEMCWRERIQNERLITQSTKCKPPCLTAEPLPLKKCISHSRFPPPSSSSDFTFTAVSVGQSNLFSKAGHNETFQT